MTPFAVNSGLNFMLLMLFYHIYTIKSRCIYDKIKMIAGKYDFTELIQ